MKRTATLLLLILLQNYFAEAQSSQSLNSAEILQGISKLNTLGTVLYVAAHPDDENTRLLAYLSKERKVRTGYLSITRGDGGQNLTGKEQGELLGLTRTQELLAARGVDGAEQFFTRANDFGYSKNPEETFNFWNKDSVLADMVWVIRNFRPDVIICRFPATGEGGHGHHTASAILAMEAFDAAADPKRFPTQLKYTQAWQAKRIYWNTFNFGGRNTTSPDQLKTDVGGFNPLLGKSYGEIAAESRSMHKSQGFGSAPTRGTNLEYFKFLKGEDAKQDLFEGIDLSWKRIGVKNDIEAQLKDIIARYNPMKPQNSVAALARLYTSLQSLPEKDATAKYWKVQKLKELEDLIINSAGLWLEADAAEYAGIPGSRSVITAHIINRSGLAVKLNKIDWFGKADTMPGMLLKTDELLSSKQDVTLAGDLPYSGPYWLNMAHTNGTYTVKDQQLIGMAENKPALYVSYELEISGIKLKAMRPVVYKSTDPVKGEVYRPFEILPPATVNLTDKAFVFDASRPRRIQFTVKANTDDVNGQIDIKLPEGWKLTLDNKGFTLPRKGDEKILEAEVTPASKSTGGMMYVALSMNDKTYNKSLQRVEYDHIPYQFILQDAEARLVNIDLKKEGTNIGYIPGAGDDVPAALKQVGYTVTMLTDEMLTNGDLGRYDAIVSGIRAYNTNDRLQLHYERLMKYVQNGGNLIIQYNTNNRIGPVLSKIGPYPFNITRNRVTDETAEIRIVNPKHRVLNYPNKIDNNDFENWIQERGIYFADEYDKNFETIFSMNDPGEEPNEGSLIIAKYGKGNFVYTGLVFFRELPAGVPGAYRLFANLLSLPENK